MLNLSVVLEDSARRYPTRDALVLGDTRISYAELDSRSNRVANLLVERGIEPGDTVAMSFPNMPEFPIVYYGILKAGAVVVPLNIMLKGREIAYHLEDSGAKAYFCFEGGPDLPIGEFGRAGFGSASQCSDMFVAGGEPGTGTTDIPISKLHWWELRTCSRRWYAHRRTPQSSSTRAAPPENPKVRSSPTPTW